MLTNLRRSPGQRGRGLRRSYPKAEDVQTHATSVTPLAEPLSHPRDTSDCDAAPLPAVRAASTIAAPPLTEFTWTCDP
jgi:hypothetical protein